MAIFNQKPAAARAGCFMRRHAGDYLLGTMFLAVAMLLAVTHAKSESVDGHSDERADIDHIFPASHWKSATERQPSTFAIQSWQPACAVLKGLSRGTRIVVGSLDVSGGRHKLSVTVGTCEPVGVCEPGRIESLPVARCSASNIRHWRHENSLVSPMPCGAETQGFDHPIPFVVPPSGGHSSARVFLTPHFVDTGTVHEPAECRFIGDSPRVRIYVDQRLVQSGNGAHSTVWSVRLTSAAESRALPIVEAWVGTIRDVDFDQKLSIVVTDLDRRGRHASGSSPIHGCIRERDFRSDFDFCGDIIYVDPSIFGLPTDELASLLTHEATHAAICSIRPDDSTGVADTENASRTGEGSQVPAWLNEAVAHFVELQCRDEDGRIAVMSENFRSRMDEFFANPAGSPIVAAENVLNLEERRGGSRGAATLFLARWFSTRATLQQFVQSQTTFESRIENLAQEPFPDVFRDWTLSLAARCISPASPNAMSHEHMSLRSDLLPVAGNQVQFSLFGTAFRCFECSEDIESLVIESNDAAKLQVTIMEPDALVTTQVLSGFVSHATFR